MESSFIIRLRQSAPISIGKQKKKTIQTILMILEESIFAMLLSHHISSSRALGLISIIPRRRFLLVSVERACTFRCVVFTGDSLLICPHLSLCVPFLNTHLELVGLLGAGAGPLVASGVGELVAVRSDEVVEDSGATGACGFLLAL
jgi:hypothetical protein